MLDENKNMQQGDKQEMIEDAKKLPRPEEFSLRPRDFAEAYRFANLIAESDLIPKEFQKKPANVLVAVQLGMELGVSPMQALQNIFVVNGRPAIFGDLLPAIVLASGLLEKLEETGDDKLATCTVKRKGFAPITRTFSYAEAERAGLPGRNPTYKSYPKRMLAMRARAYAFRDQFADLLKGVAIKEDIEDVEERDVTPPQEPIKAPQALDQKLAGGIIIATIPPIIEFDPPPSIPPSKADVPAEPEQPKDDKIDKFLESMVWVQNASDDELTARGALEAHLKGLKQNEQLEVCKIFNARKKALLESSKK